MFVVEGALNGLLCAALFTSVNRGAKEQRPGALALVFRREDVVLCEFLGRE